MVPHEGGEGGLRHGHETRTDQSRKPWNVQLGRSHFYPQASVRSYYGYDEHREWDCTFRFQLLHPNNCFYVSIQDVPGRHIGHVLIVDNFH